jgi:cytidyltransferase-like protein
MKKVGFTIGKFAPFHKGHEYLIETAIKETDEFYVVIYDTDVIDVPIETRAKWIKDKFNNVKIIYAFNSPRQYGLDDESVKIQMEYLSKKIEGIPVNYFFSSELYGEKVAQYLKIENRVVDMSRIQVPISAGVIREDIEKYKEFLDSKIYNEIKAGF